MDPSTNAVPLLEVRDMVKDYGPVHVLKGLDFDVAAGEVRALMGANGAGKSTLVKCIGGIEALTGGSMRLRGKEHRPTSPAEAQRSGIAIVHQELSLIPGLTVAENITVGRWPVRSVAGLRVVNKRRLLAEAGESLDLIGEDLPLGTVVDRLSPAKQQLVEIAKALATRPDVLILDEPTSSLAAQEVERLIRLVRRLADQGVAVIYVSHRMDEIPRVADSVTVLRDGDEVATRPIAAMDTATIAEMMIGRELSSRADAAQQPLGDVVLSVEDLRVPGAPAGVSFEVRSGEIVGIAGLMGSGRTEILRGIFGLDPATGVVKVHGEEIERRSPRTMRARGVGMTPEDRKAQGLVLGLSVRENLLLTCYDRVKGRFGALSSRRERELALTSIRDQSIAVSGPAQLAGQLSGGNQQKIVIGKWVNRGVDILLMDEPTRGVDVHAKGQTYSTIVALAERGAAVVFVSSEVEEIFQVCHRVLVVHGGSIVAERLVDETDAREVLTLSMEEGAAA